jgi:peptidoglycan/LPS O-acetylase OafA/YrhL
MSATNKPKFYDQIDGLRCFCVIGVLMQHFIDPRYTKFLYTANIGVDLFFVISGFLITEILIHMKKDHTVGRALYVFYSRRILRIFPLYYLYWFLLVVFFYSDIRDSLAWGLLYIFNFYAIGHNNVPIAGHLWSLAVEEQFYLAWPLILMVTPLKWLKTCIVSLLVLSVVFLMLKFQPGTYEYTYHHTFSCSVSLLTGALLAYLKVHTPQNVVRILPKLWWTPLFGLLGSLALCYLVQRHTLQEGYLIFIRFFVCLAGFYLIGKMALAPFKGLAGKIFLNKFARQIGRISYGVYIYHMIVFVALAPFMDKLFTRMFSLSLFSKGVFRYIKYNPSLFKMPVFAVAVILVAWLSYVIYEVKFLRLKRLFQ